MHHLQLEPSPRRVRAYFAGVPIVDTTRAHLVWENPHYPAYYLPRDAFRAGALVPSAHVRAPDPRGVPHSFDVQVGDRVARHAAWAYPDSPFHELHGLVRLEWASMDAWFEEEEEVFVHPKDPHKRIDILHGSRHVVVSCRGVRLAETRRPTLLFETGLPPRFYVPRTDVRMELLTPLERRTGCAYKGFARYWGLAEGGELVEQDVAWSYPTPLPECVKIAGLLGFYNETLDIEVDGVLLDRPVTEFSRSPVATPSA